MHSFYTWLSNGGVFNPDYEVLWKSHVPLKIHIFSWLVRINKILTRVNLQKKEWKGCITCLFFEKDETIEPLFVMWIICLERNSICFQNKNIISVKIIGIHILSLVTYWYQQDLANENNELTLILPPNVNQLNFQVGSIMRVQEEDIT
jgi:zinc-binding in reverse transcriptase